VISDPWPGLDRYFRPGYEVLVAEGPEDVLRWLRDLPETRRRHLGQNARRRVLAEHTAWHRALALERYVRRAGVKPAGPMASRRTTLHAVEMPS
jgi:spore maturation protein CgeB